MLGSITKLEVKIGEKTYLFLCDSDSPIGAVHDALSTMKGFVVQRINDSEKTPECPEGECKDG